MITKEKLAAMPYAQAHIVRRPNAIVLVSYTTEVAEIRGGCLTVKGLYSATTRKHISAFCRQFGTDYCIAKECYLRGLQYDIVTKQFSQRVGV
jgi:hypothetical protein